MVPRRAPGRRSGVIEYTEQMRTTLLLSCEKMMTANQSIRRVGKPIEVAYAVLFLAGDESQWITGVNLPLDGGYTAR